VVQHLHKVKHPREFVVFTSVLDQLDKDLIEFELFCCDFVGSQLIGTECIPESVKM
jgi:hypothetical protein